MGRAIRPPARGFVIQDEISGEISGKLRLQLTHAEKKRLTRRQTEDPEAYQLYLKGRTIGIDGRKKDFTKQLITFPKRSRRI